MQVGALNKDDIINLASSGVSASPEGAVRLSTADVDLTKRDVLGNML